MGKSFLHLRSGINLPVLSAPPLDPQNGDVWFEGSELFARIAGVSTSLGAGGDPTLSDTIAPGEVSPTPITGFIVDKVFNRAFVAEYSIWRPYGASELVTQGTLRGVYRESTDTWELGGEEFAGDVSGVVFTIDSSGQVYYTSSVVPVQRIVVLSESTTTAYYSDDGVTFTAATCEDGTWRNVAWSPTLGMFAAVATGGPQRLQTSTDGISWNAATPSSVTSWQDIVWADSLGLFLAVSQSGTAMRSSDGSTWLASTLSNNPFAAVAWSESLGVGVTVATSANTVATTTDGITWSDSAPSANEAWRDVVWAEGLGLFVAVASTGAVQVMTSPDGINWTNQAASSPQSWFSIAWSETLGLLVAVANSAGVCVMTSPDGVNWTDQTSPNTNSQLAVEWNEQLGLFIVASDAGTNRIMTSPDGIAWTAIAADASDNRALGTGTILGAAGPDGEIKFTVKRL